MRDDTSTTSDHHGPTRGLHPWHGVVAAQAVLLPLIAIVALIGYFTSVNHLFFSIENALNIGRQSSVLLLVALAETIIILIGSIDLSVGSIVTLVGILAAGGANR